MDIIIYGAQGIALGVYEALRSLYPEKHTRCFLVSERGREPSVLSGIPVIETKKLADGLDKEEKGGIKILIATPENVMPEIENYLEECGFCNYQRITSRIWAELMAEYYSKRGDFVPVSVSPDKEVIQDTLSRNTQTVERRSECAHMPDIFVYMARHQKDKLLSSAYSIPVWITPVHAGAALSPCLLENIQDNCGENISFKNPNYSELTVLYWLWKNGMKKDGYYGLCHYRRYLELSNEDRMCLQYGSVDAVLPFPMPYEPNIEEHHKRYLKDEDWQAVLMAVREIAPDYTEDFKEVLGGRYFYNYNLLIAKRDVLDTYCGWLFPILERIEELSIPKGWKRGDRYIGYVGETLTTLYFMTNKDGLNIRHTGCIFLT